MRVGRVERRVSARVPERAVEHHVSAPANAQRERRIQPRSIRRDRGAPDRVDRLAIEAHASRLLLGTAVRNFFGGRDANQGLDAFAQKHFLELNTPYLQYGCTCLQRSTCVCSAALWPRSPSFELPSARAVSAQRRRGSLFSSSSVEVTRRC